MKLSKFLLAVGLLLTLVVPTLGAQAVILPNGRTQFLDSNGDPLAGGSVGTYVPPNTLTPKTTWQDSAEATPNANPITLDSSGSALIYGAGNYRELVRDALGNTIFDAQTSGFDPTTACPLAGCTFTGPVIIPTLSVGNLTVTGTTVSPALYPPGYLYGCALSNDSGTPTTSLDITACDTKDSTNANSMTGAASVKSLASNWTVGTGNGCLDAGSSGNLTYHVFSIERLDTGLVDYICSLANGSSATVAISVATPAVVTWSASNGMQIGSRVVFSTTGALPTGITAGTSYYVISSGYSAGTSFEIATSQGGAAVNTTGSQSGTQTLVSAPALPTAYSLFRRIGSIVVSGGAIKPFVQDGDYFTWSSPVNDISGFNPGTSAVTRTLTLPIGVRVRARLAIAVFAVNSAASESPISFLVSDLATTDVTPSASAANNFSIALYSGVTSPLMGGAPVDVFTNQVGQVRSRLALSTAGTAFFIETLGWVDGRGRI